MSLINQMLKDLDARHAAEVRNDLHREVRALPAARTGGNWRPLAFGGAAVLAAAVAAWLVYERFAYGTASPPPAAAVAPRPAAEVPPAQPPAAPAVTGGDGDPAPLAPGLPASPLLAPESAGTPPVTVMPPVAPAPAAVTASTPPAPAPVPAAGAGGSEVPASPAPAVAAKAVGAKPAASPPAAAGGAKEVKAPATDRPVASRSEEVPATAVVEKRPPAKSGRERADADYQRAVALAGNGRSGEAIDALLDVLRQEGGHAPSRQLLARLLVEQGRSDEALALLVEGLAGQPGQLPWAISAARLLVDRGDAEAAARILQGSLPFASANADYLGFAGYLAHRLGRQPEAVEHYRSAARIAPGDGRWWLGLGLALEAGQRPAEAREAFLRARASGTLNADLAAVVDQKLR